MIQMIGVFVFFSLFFSPGNDWQDTSELQESIERGELIYEDFCMNCHLPDGKGSPGSFPPLANADYLLENREASIRAVKYGLSGEITVNGVIYNADMASQGLMDDEIADVMNYILNSWGNEDGKIVTPSEVSKIER